MTALSTAGFTAYIERKYIKPQDMLTSILAASPFLGIIEKDTTMGDYVDVPINDAAPAGVSPSYSTAVAAQAPGTYKKFVVQPVLLYAYGKVANAAIRSAAAKGDKTLTLQPLNNEMKRLKQALTVQLCANAMGSYGFALGRANATPGGTDYVLTLKEPSDHYKFYPGMQIAASATDGTSGSLRDSGDTCTLTKVTRAGTSGSILTTDTGYWTTVINGLIGDDYLFGKGCFGAGAYGLSDWIPSSEPGGSDSFTTGAVNRSVDPTTLAGWRIVGTGMPIEEAINNAIGVCSVGGSTPTAMIVNPMDMAAILNAYKSTAMPNTVYATGEGAVAKIGYKSVQVQTMAGPLQVFQDRFKSKGSIKLVTPDSFTLLSSGELVKFLEVDEKGGFFRLTPAGEDSSEFTAVAQWQLICNAPGKNAHISIA